MVNPSARFGRIEAVVNIASGSVGKDAAQQLEAILGEAGLKARVASPPPEGIADAVKAAVASKPDLLILLAGDGTAALAAELCGMDGPLLAPLPGGTMNMLPHAFYGRRSWPEALKAALSEGAERIVSGGEAGGRPFYVAAILGAPALWGEAREAVRKRKFKLALLRARRALLHAFSSRLRFRLDGAHRRKAGALTLMCPLVSRAMQSEDGLEAAALDPRGALEAFRLGLRALVGGWRDDPTVSTQICREGQAWARGRIPVVLDGEPHRLDSPVSIRFIPQAFRALAPPPESTAAPDPTREGEKAGAEAAGSAAATDALAKL